MYLFIYLFIVCLTTLSADITELRNGKNCEWKRSQPIGNSFPKFTNWIQENHNLSPNSCIPPGIKKRTANKTTSTGL